MPKTREGTFIYVIGTITGPFKIGIAARPEARLRQLQTGNHFKLSLFDTIPVRTADAPRVERNIHKALSAHHLSGEWFEVSRERAVAAVADAIAMFSGNSPAAEPATISPVGRATAYPVFSGGWPSVEPTTISSVGREAARSGIIFVEGVNLVHKVTFEEKFAEDDRINQAKRAAVRERIQALHRAGR
ncbi:MAG TPA: GIY-YIG nuclease family protein [Stellaceae bacterium]|nr:GIY-YIG nuclease family protein [Stellaceae bacterium]